MRKVVKFGGSSLASAEQFKKVGDIIRADKGRKYVVPSAPGKRFDGDIKLSLIHISEPTRRTPISYAVFCLKKKKKKNKFLFFHSCTAQKEANVMLVRSKRQDQN